MLVNMQPKAKALTPTIIGTGGGGLMWATDHLHLNLPQGFYIGVALISIILILFGLYWWVRVLIAWLDKGMKKEKIKSMLWIIGGVIIVLVGIGMIYHGIIQIKPTDITNITNQPPQNQSAPEQKSVGIDIEGGSANLRDNLIIGFSTGIKGKNADISGRGNVIDRGQRQHQFPPPTGEFKDLSNSDLVKRVKDLAAQIRGNEQNYDTRRENIFMGKSASSKDMNAKIEKLQKENEEEFKKLFLPTALSLASEIIFRLKKVEIPSNAEPLIMEGGENLTRGMLAGAYPMSSIAYFLEYIAGRLPH